MRRVFILISCLSAALPACSSGTSEPEPASVPPVVISPEKMTAPNMESPAPAVTQKGSETSNVPDGGTVLSTIDVPGSKTMYMELERDGKRFWIASATIEVKAGDQVTYDTNDAVMMKNFASKALERSFDEVILVANARIKP